MQRRRFVTMAGAGISFSLAGCSSLISESESPQKQSEPPSKSNESLAKEVVTLGNATPIVSAKAKAEIIEAKFITKPPGTTPENILRALIKNTGEVPLGFAEVSVQLYNQAGSILVDRSEYIHALKPGQVWIFYKTYVTVHENDPPVEASIELSELDPGFVNYAPPPEVKLSNLNFKPGDEPAISGDATNTAETPIRVYITIQFLSEQKRVLDTIVNKLNISPGETHAFGGDISLNYYAPEQATGYEIWVQCNR